MTVETQAVTLSRHIYDHLKWAGFESSILVQPSEEATIRAARFPADGGYCFVDGHVAVRELGSRLDIDYESVSPRYRPAVRAAVAGQIDEARVLLAGFGLPTDVVDSAEFEVHLAASGTPTRSAYAGSFCEPHIVDVWDGVVQGSPFAAEAEALAQFLHEYGGHPWSLVRVHTSQAIAEVATGKARAQSEASKRLVAAMDDRRVDLIFAPRDHGSAGYVAARETARWLYAQAGDA